MPDWLRPEWLDWLRLDSYEAFAVLLVIVWITYMAAQRIGERRSREVKAAAFEAGLSEPPSLHPVIDPAKCIGCGACANMCPEGKVLGLIKDKAELIEPSSCIGHGACKTSCPTNAITLVFGTATRGVDIPQVSPSFETSVPGLFIAGELGGMGLIANAVEQGRQAMTSVSKLDGLKRRDRLDVVIVGSGPAGISASLAARELGLNAVTLEQETFGGTVAHYPRGKVVMTRPAELPLFGKVKVRKVRKERLLELWTAVARRHRLAIRYGERVERVQPTGGGFEVQSTRGRYAARAVLLAIGRRGSPRKLGVPGEHLSKVVYSLVDPAQYRGSRVLVVGGGDSALEAAANLAAERNVEVILCYRGAVFSRARAQNRQRIEAADAQRRVRVLYDSTLLAIHPHHVDLTVAGQPYRTPNDAVIICAGGIMPGAFLREIGVDVETKYGAA